MLFNDDDLERSVDVSSLFGEGKRWYTFGGHRMWVTPEKMPDTYYPDQQPVAYETEEKDGGIFVTLCPEEQKFTNVKHKIIVCLTAENTLRIDHYLTNTGKETKNMGIWGITVTAKNGIGIVKQPEFNRNLLPNRSLVLWPYTKLNDKRLIFGEDYIAVRQDPNAEIPAKIGYTNSEGRIYCFNHGQVMTISYTPDYENGVYPDFNISTEIYTNNAILELETLGHISDVLPGETVSHTEVWTVAAAPEMPEDNEDSIRSAMNKAGY